MLKIRLAVFWIVAVLLVLPAAAQDSGEYLILNCLYGNKNHHVDVTNRIKELARQDRRFRVSHDSMAVDPDPGHAKSLRVFARGPNGYERMFEFQDNSTFDGGQFRSWGRGDWGDQSWNGGWNWRPGGDEGQFLILSAQYGSEARHVDVTQRLKDLARQDRVFRLDYRTFGVDPDEGHAKVLRIFARGSNGRERMFEYRDNSLIDGAIFSSWRSGDWGHGGWSGNWNGGGYGGGYGGDSGQFLIVSAQYGSERRHVDVTSRLKELARPDRQFRLDYRTFGVDPDQGHAKVLHIFARGPRGRERMFEYRDGSLIDGALFRGWGEGRWGDADYRWSGRWEGEERDDRDRDRDRDRDDR